METDGNSVNSSYWSSWRLEYEIRSGNSKHSLCRSTVKMQGSDECVELYVSTLGEILVHESYSLREAEFLVPYSTVKYFLREN